MFFPLSLAGLSEVRDLSLGLQRSCSFDLVLNQLCVLRSTRRHPDPKVQDGYTLVLPQHHIFTCSHVHLAWFVASHNQAVASLLMSIHADQCASHCASSAAHCAVCELIVTVPSCQMSSPPARVSVSPRLDWEFPPNFRLVARSTAPQSTTASALITCHRRICRTRRFAPTYHPRLSLFSPRTTPETLAAPALISK